jgi:hypothetical protein
MLTVTSSKLFSYCSSGHHLKYPTVHAAVIKNSWPILKLTVSTHKLNRNVICANKDGDRFKNRWTACWKWRSLLKMVEQLMEVTVSIHSSNKTLLYNIQASFDFNSSSYLSIWFMNAYHSLQQSFSYLVTIAFLNNTYYLSVWFMDANRHF